MEDMPLVGKYVFVKRFLSKLLLKLINDHHNP